MSIDQAQREFEAYRKDDAEARAILDKAAEENRSTTAEEDERFDKLAESATAHNARAKGLAESAADANTVENLLATVRHTTATMQGTQGELDAGLIANMRAVVEGHRNGVDARELTSEYKMPSSEELRALSDFATGGSLYVNDFRTTVAVYQRTMSPWLALGTIVNGTDGRPLNLPLISADPTAYSPGEGTAITAADPTIGTAVATPVSYKALGYISMELDEDEQVGLLPYIAKTQGRSLGLMAGSAFTSTIVTAATNGGTASGKGGGGGTAGTVANTFVGYEDLIDLKYGAAAPYRMVGVWIMANSVIKLAKKFKDGQGQYLWQPAISLGTPDMFDGNPVYEDPYLVAAASVSKSVLFGDPSAVVIKQLPLRVAVSDQFVFNLDQIAIKAVYRGGAALPDAAAIRYLISANS